MSADPFCVVSLPGSASWQDAIRLAVGKVPRTETNRYNKRNITIYGTVIHLDPLGVPIYDTLPSTVQPMGSFMS